MRPATSLFSAFLTLICLGCGGADKRAAELDLRPLEESKAFEIIAQMFAERGYFLTPDQSAAFTGGAYLIPESVVPALEGPLGV